MLLLGPIVFVGIVGHQHQAVEHQLEPSLDKAGISELAIPDDERAAIVKHTAASKRVIKSLHVSGVVAGQLSGAGDSRTFRVVIYDGDGNLTSDLESPIAASGLTRGNLDMFEATVADLGGAPVHGAPPRVAAAPAPADDEDAKTDAPVAVGQHATASPGEHGIHVRLGLVAGVVGRSLAVDPNTVRTYSSTPVGTGGFEGAIDLGARAHLTGSYEHTLVMHTAVGQDNASTMIGRGEVLASYDVLHGGVRVAPAVGFGTRYFAIDTTSNARSPDIEYLYVVLGATVAKPLGTRWTVRGLAAFEPVVGGLVPAMLPDPARWGFDLGAAVEVRATAHVFARAAFDYQSFASSWVSHGSATDAYPTGTAAAGAVF